MRVICKDILLAENAIMADSMYSRIMGLMFKKEMKKFDGLILKPCYSIHTFFMRFKIDVVFLDRKDQVIKVIKNMKPWRVSWIYFRSNKVLELNGGTIQAELKTGDKVEIICTN